MLETALYRQGDLRGAFLLVHDGVTSVATLGYHFAGGAHMLAIMAAEAPSEIEMTDVIWVGLPIYLHFREVCPLENFLYLIDRIANFELLRFGQFGYLLW